MTQEEQAFFDSLNEPEVKKPFLVSLQPREPLMIGNGAVYMPDKWYVMENCIAAGLHKDHGAKIAPFTKKIDSLEGIDLSGKSLLIERVGGLGDVLFMTPALIALRDKFPTCKIAVGTSVGFGIVLPDWVQVERFPTDLAVAESYDYVLNMTHVIEFNERAKEVHPVHLFAERLNVEVKDPQIVLNIDMELQGWARLKFPKTKKLRVGIQAVSSAACRNYPRLQEVISGLQFKEVEIYAFGQSMSINMPSNQTIENLSERALPIEKSVAVISTCDCFIGPDSGLLHVAGAMNIPTLALYAAFPWQLRTAFQPSIKALSGHAPCAPCFHHPWKQTWPKGMPCETKGHCVAMAEIDPARIIAWVTAMIK